MQTVWKDRIYLLPGKAEMLPGSSRFPVILRNGSVIFVSIARRV